MDLSLNETQQLLKQGVEDFLSRDATREAIVELAGSELGYSQEMWRTAAENRLAGDGDAGAIRRQRREPDRRRRRLRGTRLRPPCPARSSPPACCHR